MFNEEKRIFYISGDITNSSIGDAYFNLLMLLHKDDEEDKKQKDFTRNPIKIYINSFGGSVYDMWSLIDVIENSKTPIYTYCTGYAMSAAFNIFLSGHKRFATKHATFMYHQMSCFRAEKYQDLVEDMVEFDFLNRKIEEYVMYRTNITKGRINEIREKKIDEYIHADEALNLGIVDEIIS